MSTYPLTTESRPHHFLADVRTDVRPSVSASALDILHQGVVLLNSSHRVVLVNRSAEAMVRQADGLRLEGQRLRFRDGAASARFERFVDAALSSGGNRSAESEWVLAVERPSGAAPYHVAVSALPSLSSQGSEGGAAVLIADPEAALRPGAGALRILFHLTCAEERLAIALLAGKTLEEFARDQSVSKETARAQLREVFAKTGVNRQSELIRILSCSAITARC